jgi:hypothetical protein
MKLLRTIRLDQSDTFIFAPIAEPGEWAVSGCFMFWDGDPTMLQGKMRSAFRSGFLGVQSLGWSTLVQIVEASAEDRRQAVEQLAHRLVEKFGAPDMKAATAAAEDEIAFAESLAIEDKDTLVAVHRSVEGGEIREAFRTLKTRSDRRPIRAYSFLNVEDAPPSPDDEVSLAELATRDVK